MPQAYAASLTACMQTPSDKLGADRYGGTDHPSRRRRHTQNSPQRQVSEPPAKAATPANAPRTPPTTKNRPPTPRETRRRTPQRQSPHNAAQAKTHKPIPPRPRLETRRRRQQDAAVKPPAGHSVAAARSKPPKPPAARSSPNAATRAPRKAPNTVPTCVETKKPKPRREVRHNQKTRLDCRQGHSPSRLDTPQPRLHDNRPKSTRRRRTSAPTQDVKRACVALKAEDHGTLEKARRLPHQPHRKPLPNSPHRPRLPRQPILPTQTGSHQDQPYFLFSPPIVVAKSAGISAGDLGKALPELLILGPLRGPQ